MTKKIFTTAALLSCLLVSFKASTSVEGKWKGTYKTPDGNEYPVTYNFKAESGLLAGVATFPKGTIINGKVEGIELSFDVPVYGSPIQHTGKYYTQADSIGMDIQLNGKTLHATLLRDNE
jgi:hypothetical protein